MQLDLTDTDAATSRGTVFHLHSLGACSLAVSARVNVLAFPAIIIDLWWDII